MSGPNARITVTRTHSSDVRDRQVIVSVDGDRLGLLLYGDESSRELEPGAHRVRAHNTLFWKTLSVRLQSGEPARFNVVNRAGFGTYLLAGLFGVGPLYLTLERVPDAA